MNNTFFKSFVLHKSNSKSPKEMWHDASTTDRPELDQLAKKITQMKYQKKSVPNNMNVLRLYWGATNRKSFWPLRFFSFSVPFRKFIDAGPLVWFSCRFGDASLSSCLDKIYASNATWNYSCECIHKSFTVKSILVLFWNACPNVAKPTDMQQSWKYHAFLTSTIKVLSVPFSNLESRVVFAMFSSAAGRLKKISFETQTAVHIKANNVFRTAISVYFFVELMRTITYCENYREFLPLFLIYWWLPEAHSERQAINRSNKKILFQSFQ